MAFLETPISSNFAYFHLRLLKWKAPHILIHILFLSHALSEKIVIVHLRCAFSLAWWNWWLKTFGEIRFRCAYLVSCYYYRLVLLGFVISVNLCEKSTMLGMEVEWKAKNSWNWIANIQISISRRLHRVARNSIRICIANWKRIQFRTQGTIQRALLRVVLLVGRSDSALNRWVESRLWADIQW